MQPVLQPPKMCPDGGMQQSRAGGWVVQAALSPKLKAPRLPGSATTIIPGAA